MQLPLVQRPAANPHSIASCTIEKSAIWTKQQHNLENALG